MPYPIDRPMNKHDLVGPSDITTSTNLINQFGYNNTKELFHALESDIPTDIMKTITPVYSYSDAPKPPLSRSLIIIGVADTSLSVVRKLVGDTDDIPSCLHQCTIAVKRADDSQIHQLKPVEIQNSKKFAKFIRQLHNDGIVAILSSDKYKRFGILKPMDDITTSGDYEPQDFSVSVYVGDINKVKQFLTQGIIEKPIVTTTNERKRDADTAGLWQPPGSSSSNGNDDDNNIADSNGFWKPPGAVNDATNFGDTNGDSGAGLWQPPTATTTTTGFGEDNNNFFNSTDSANPWGNSGGDSNEQDNNNINTNGGDNSNDNEFHADAGAAAADKFYSGLTRTLDTRADSRLYHMRAYNGWVKATQIQELDPKTTSSSNNKKNSNKKNNNGLRVLDLACGKGGDLGKWVIHNRGISNYVGIDVARGSLVDAAIRARKMGRTKLSQCTFTCADLGSDVPGRLKYKKNKYMQKLLSWSLHNEKTSIGDPEFKMIRGGGISLDDKFDVVSIQFAIHYMMQTRKRARRFFQTVSSLLDIGGNLIATTIDARIVIDHLMNMGLNLHNTNSTTLTEPAVVSTGAGACRITFEPEIVQKIFTTVKTDDPLDENLFGMEYTFTLVEGSDHASGVGDAVNLPEWLIPIPVLVALGKEAGLELESAENFHEFFYNRSDPKIHSTAHSSMYNMKVLNRNGTISKDEYDISRLYVALKFRKVRESTIIDDLDDDDDDENNDDDDEDEEIDPTIKAKFLPIALMKAKKSTGNDVWSSLSSDEKNKLTDIELRKLAKGS